MGLYWASKGDAGLNGDDMGLAAAGSWCEDRSAGSPDLGVGGENEALVDSLGVTCALCNLPFVKFP
jgi:hypothetical protein